MLAANGFQGQGVRTKYVLHHLIVDTWPAKTTVYACTETYFTFREN